MILILFGPPGSGKGTQASLISNAFKMHHLSTGNILKSEVAKNSDLGKKVSNTLAEGKLVSDDLVSEIVQVNLSTLSGNVILDGYPRTITQAELLNKMDLSNRFLRVIHATVDEEFLVNRLISRVVCSVCGTVSSSENKSCPSCESKAFIRRNDDNLEVIKERLRVYKVETEPVLTYYKNRGILSNINGNGTVDFVFEQISVLLNNWTKKD